MTWKAQTYDGTQADEEMDAGVREVGTYLNVSIHAALCTHLCMGTVEGCSSFVPYRRTKVRLKMF